MKITKDEKNLIITIPLKQKGSNPYDESIYELDNIIGAIMGNEYGFMGLNDMSYCGKDPQISDWFVKFSEISDNSYQDEDRKEKTKWFKDLCKRLDIELYVYPICAYCKKVIFGSHTFGSKGNKCFDCSNEYKNKK